MSPTPSFAPEFCDFFVSHTKTQNIKKLFYSDKFIQDLLCETLMWLKFNPNHIPKAWQKYSWEFRLQNLDWFPKTIFVYPMPTNKLTAATGTSFWYSKLQALSKVLIFSEFSKPLNFWYFPTWSSQWMSPASIFVPKCRHFQRITQLLHVSKFFGCQILSFGNQSSFFKPQISRVFLAVVIDDWGHLCDTPMSHKNNID